MQESSASTSTLRLPFWGRLAFACFMFLVSAVTMWKKFFRFDWVEFLCFGLYALLWVPMQKGDAPKTYFGKPRNVISFALLIVAVAFALRDLAYLSTR